METHLVQERVLSNSLGSLIEFTVGLKLHWSHPLFPPYKTPLSPCCLGPHCPTPVVYFYQFHFVFVKVWVQSHTVTISIKGLSFEFRVCNISI